MNILYLTNELNYSDGVSAHLYYLLKNLIRKKDINIYIMCGGGNGIDKFNPVSTKIIVHENVNHKTRSIKNFTSAIHSVYKFVKNNSVNIIHSHNHYAANIGFKAAKFSDVKTVQTVHGLIPEKGRLKHFSADSFIAVNDHIADHLLKKNIQDNKINLIYNGIDYEGDIRKKENIFIKIITASRLEEGKGIDIFIKAAAGLSAEIKNKTKFYVAGGGSLESELKTLNDKLNAGIIFMGDLKDLRSELNKTDIFIIASQSEGLPMTLLEAAAAKNFIISSDFPGVENIFTDKEDGYIFKMNDVDDLILKIKSAIENSNSKDIAESFYHRAETKFNAAQMADHHYNLYQDLIG